LDVAFTSGLSCRRHSGAPLEYASTLHPRARGARRGNWNWRCIRRRCHRDTLSPISRLRNISCVQGVVAALAAAALARRLLCALRRLALAAAAHDRLGMYGPLLAGAPRPLPWGVGTRHYWPFQTHGTPKTFRDIHAPQFFWDIPAGCVAGGRGGGRAGGLVGRAGWLSGRGRAGAGARLPRGAVGGGWELAEPVPAARRGMAAPHPSLLPAWHSRSRVDGGLRGGRRRAVPPGGGGAGPGPAARPRGDGVDGRPPRPRSCRRPLPPPGEKDAVSVQKFFQLHPSIAVFPPECKGQFASFGPT
jgi:hypothetical protein